MNFIEFLYYAGYSLKKRYALKHQKRLPYKVISIGNVTLGGTGKTPATISLSREAKKRGFNPCILTRGYKGIAKSPCIVSKGEGPMWDELHSGDEAFLMANKLKGVPVVKGKKRYEAGLFALQNLRSQISNLESQNIFILDDGFQHWYLYRDKDILLIDSKNPFGNKRLLPLGTLREPVTALGRADIIVITKTPAQSSAFLELVKGKVSSQKSSVNSLIDKIRQYNSIAPIFSAEHRPSAFVTMSGNTFPLEWAKDKKFFYFCGIGSPGSFRDTLLSIGLEIKGHITFRDHYRYTVADFQKIKRDADRVGADWIVTTEKDIMRLMKLKMPDNLVALSIDFVIDEEFYLEAFKI